MSLMISLLVLCVASQQIPVDGCQGTIVNCVVAPCDTAKCEKYPDAICANDYCDGCNARFFDASDTEYQSELECSYVSKHT